MAVDIEEDELIKKVFEEKSDDIEQTALKQEEIDELFDNLDLSKFNDE